MGLSLLAPASLALAVTVGVAVLAHWMRRPPRARRAFGAMLILRRMRQKIRRRRRVEDPWLLLLRALAMLSLVLAAAGPQLRWSAPTLSPSAGGPAVILLDRSLSMGRAAGGGSAFAWAVARAEEELGRLPPEQPAALVVFDQQAARAVPTLTTDRVALREALERASLGEGGTDLAQALREARAILGGAGGEVWVLSDLAGGWRTQAAEEALAALIGEGAAVVPLVPPGDGDGNAAVVAARQVPGVEGGRLVLEVVHHGAAAREVRCEVTLPGEVSAQLFLTLPAEGTAREGITLPRGVAGGPAVARCDDGVLGGDDALPFLLEGQAKGAVRVLDGAPGDTPLAAEAHFLLRALEAGGLGGVEVLSSVPPDARGGVLILANVSDPLGSAPGLEAFVREGGALLITGGDNVSPERYSRALAGLLPGPLRVDDLAGPGERGAALLPPVAPGPLLAPLGWAGGEPLRTRRALGFSALREDARVLLRYEGGHPALVERMVGAGRVLVWTSTLDLGWGAGPLSPQYPALVQRLVAGLGGGVEGGGGAALVGEWVRDALQGRRVRDPSGALRPELRPEGWRPDRVGMWTVEGPDGNLSRRVAVRTDPAESELRLVEPLEDVERALSPALFERTLDLRPWLVGLALLLLLAQGVLALRLSRRRA